MSMEKMRRNLTRRRDDAERAERLQWLTTLTPEHRAMHERPNPLGMCGQCISEQAAQAGEQIRRAIEQISRSRAARSDK